MKSLWRKISLCYWISVLLFANLFNTRAGASFRNRACKALGKTINIRLSIGALYLRKEMVIEKISLDVGRFKISIETIKLSSLAKLFALKMPDIIISGIAILVAPTEKSEKNFAGASKESVSLARAYNRMIGHLKRFIRKCPSNLELNGLTMQTSESVILALYQLKLENSQYSISFSLRQHNFDVSGQLERKCRRLTIDKILAPSIGDFSINSAAGPIFTLNVAQLPVCELQVNIQEVVFPADLVAAYPVTLNLLQIQLSCTYSAEGEHLRINCSACANRLSGEMIICEGISSKGLIEARLKLDAFSFADLVIALPLKMKDKLLEISTNGNIQELDISFVFDPKKPITQSLEATISNNLSFLEPFPFAYLAQSFTHRPITEEHIAPTLYIGSESDGFISLEKVPAFVKRMIVHAEDPGFWEHQGIDVPLFGNAIVQNILEKKFARGGSTIAMQLARNLYLGHQKSVARKLEEIIIALLLEQASGLTKERLLEIYLNIIEFAPSIYGLKNACSFYFGIPCNQLSIQQTIVLIYIIPRPKHFVSAFLEQSPQLKTNLHLHLKRYANLLLAEGLIDKNKLERITKAVEIKGQLLEF